jgi:hypothetical protein
MPDKSGMDTVLAFRYWAARLRMRTFAQVRVSQPLPSPCDQQKEMPVPVHAQLLCALST